MEVDITFLKKNRGYYKPGHGKLTFYRMKGCSFKEKELKIILTLTFFFTFKYVVSLPELCYKINRRSIALSIPITLKIMNN